MRGRDGEVRVGSDKVSPPSKEREQRETKTDNELTAAICPLDLLHTIPNTAFPMNGPSNHPTAPDAIVAMPSTKNGSSPNKVIFSKFCCPRTIIPAPVVHPAVAREKKRL